MDDFADEFPLNSELCYLNHAAVSPWPRRTANAVQAFAKENMNFGAAHYLQWLKVEKTLRQQLQTLINAPATSDIALQKNTSEGLSVIAYGLQWQSGDHIIITKQEFPSNRIVWESLASKGVELSLVDIDCDNPEQAIIDATSNRTRLISISSVQYGTGLRLNLEVIGQHCQQNSILYCIDAIQSIGAIPIDVQQCHADFVVADAHKWMLGPEGVALFYIAEKARDQLSLNQYGWHMVEHSGQFDRQEWEIAKSARRFECGSPNMTGIHALSASLSLLLEIGINNVEQLINTKINFIINALLKRDEIRLLSPTKKAQQSGIVTFQHRHIPSQQLYQSLMDQGVICANRGGGVRFSPHFYTPEPVLEKALALIPSA